MVEKFHFSGVFVQSKDIIALVLLGWRYWHARGVILGEQGAKPMPFCFNFFFYWKIFFMAIKCLFILVVLSFSLVVYLCRFFFFWDYRFFCLTPWDSGMYTCTPVPEINRCMRLLFSIGKLRAVCYHLWNKPLLAGGYTIKTKVLCGVYPCVSVSVCVCVWLWLEDTTPVHDCSMCVCDHNVWRGGLLSGLPLLTEQRLLSGRACCDLSCWGRKMDCIQIKAGDSSDTRLFWEWHSKIKPSRPTDIYIYIYQLWQEVDKMSCWAFLVCRR